MANLDDFYGDRFTNALPKILAGVQGDLEKVYDKIIDGTVADSDKLSFLLENEASLKATIRSRFNTGYSESVAGAYADAIGQNKTSLDAAGIDVNLTESQIETVSNLKANNASLFSSRVNSEADNIFDSLVRWSSSGTEGTLSPFFVPADQISIAKHGETIVNTQIRTFSRQLNVMSGLSADIRFYRYIGPPPERPFCAALIGKIFSLKEIQQLDNGQTSNTLVTAGGFNCRHQWLPIAEGAERERTEAEIEADPDVDPEAEEEIEGEEPIEIQFDEPTDEEINERFKALGIQPPNKDLILVKKDGEIVGRMYRKVEGKSYQRATGLRQTVKPVGENFELDITDT